MEPFCEQLWKYMNINAFEFIECSIEILHIAYTILVLFISTIVLKHITISPIKKKYLELCDSYNLFTYFRSAFCIVITVWYLHEFNSIFNFSIFIDKYTDKKSVSFSNFLITMRKTLNSEKLLKNRDA